MRFLRLFFLLFLLLPSLIFAGYTSLFNKGMEDYNHGESLRQKCNAQTSNANLIQFTLDAKNAFKAAQANFEKALKKNKNKECEQKIQQTKSYLDNLSYDVCTLLQSKANKYNQKAKALFDNIYNLSFQERSSKFEEVKVQINAEIDCWEYMKIAVAKIGYPRFQGGNDACLNYFHTSLIDTKKWLKKLEDEYKSWEKYDDALVKADQAFAVEYGFSYTLNNAEVVISQLNMAGQLYEEAAANLDEAKKLIAPYDDFRLEKEVYSSKYQKIVEAAAKCRAFASSWHNEIQNQKNQLHQKLNLLDQEKESPTQALHINKMRLNVLKELLILGESVEGQIQTVEGLIAKLTEEKTNVSDSSTTFDENELRNQFFKNDAFALNNSDKTFSLFLASLSNPSETYVLPLDGQYKNPATQSYSLQKNLFYRFILRGKVPSRLCLKVFKGESQVYEEQILLPEVNSFAWEHYLTDKGKIIEPGTKIKQDFGLDLKLQFSFPNDGTKSLIISHKSNQSEYRYSLYSSDELYSFDFVNPVPWQLEELKKPVLSLAHSSLKKLTLKTQKALSQVMNEFSYELESHPLLDQFVKELKCDPLALAQYVQNEIAFSDPFLRCEQGIFQAPRIHRSAFGTFLEKRGSPWEQCSLLVYLLRKAGYTAVYAEGEPFVLPKDYAERLLGKQLKTDEALFKYPWVLFHDGQEWISLFPWMKDIQLDIGYDLYSRMPEGYQTPDLWIKKYLTNDPKIMSLVGPEGDDTVGVLFVNFLAEELRRQGLSLEDVGLNRHLLKKEYHNWKDFPRAPISKNFSFLSTLKERNDLFIGVEFKLYSKENPITSIDFSIPLVKLNCNSFKIDFDSRGGEHVLRFCSSESGLAANYLKMAPSDQHVILEVQYGFRNYPPYKFEFLKGTTAALCYDFGGASPRRTSYFAQKFDASHESEKLFNLLSFIGYRYFEKCNSSEMRLADLHKTNPMTCFRFGLAKLSPDASKGPVVGYPVLEFPQVDMVNFTSKVDGHPLSWFGDSSLSDSQLGTLRSVDNSSNEHQILREIFGDEDAVSTVKLLQIAHEEHKSKGLPETGFLVLTDKNFADADVIPEVAQCFYFPHLPNLQLRALKVKNAHQWNTVKNVMMNENHDGMAYAYMTPYPISSKDGSSYRGFGTLIFAEGAFFSLISENTGFMNGGFGTRINPDLLSNEKLKNMKLEMIKVKDSPLAGEFKGAPFVLREQYQLSHSDIIKEPLNTGLFPVVGVIGTQHKSDVRQDHKSMWDTIADPVDVVSGAFYVDEIDLSIPGPFSLELRRNYNSQNPIPSSLGYGWKLSLNPNLYEEGDKLFAAEEDGTMIVYKFSPDESKWVVSAEDNPELRNYNKKGIGSSANPYHAYFTKANDWFILHGTDGSKRIYENLKLKTWTDHLGNQLTFSYYGDYLSRVESSNGNFIGFCYDYQQRIAEAYAKDGRRVYYGYNTNSDLAQVILPNGALISYDYDQSHRIIRETKPHGRVLENVYDASSRVVEQRAPVGPHQEIIPNAYFTYSDGQTITKDASGAETIYKIYKNQIYKIIDPQGNEILQSWYLDEKTWFDANTESVQTITHEKVYPRSLKCTKDKRGLVTEYEYDLRGNTEKIILKGEDLTGDGNKEITKGFVYDIHNLCVEEYYLNNKIVNIFEQRFPYQIKRTEKYCEDAIVTYVDYEYDSKGQLIREDAAGAISFWEYDARGFPLTKTQISGTKDPDVITHYKFNNLGLCVEECSATGLVYNDYDIMGNRIQTTLFNACGQQIWTTSAGYNLNNQVIWEKGSGPHNLVFFGYNAAGLLKSTRRMVTGLEEGSFEIKPLGYSYNLFEYDSRGNLILEVDALGNSTYREYDSLSRLVSLTRENLSEKYEYESGGFITSQVAPNGATTYKSYTTNGLLKNELSPDGSESSYVYDFSGRVIKEKNNRSTWITDYDDAARKIVKRHLESGITFSQFADFRGNIIESIDPEGFVHEKIYDGLDRLITDKNPNGEVTNWNYQGDSITCTLPSGEQKIERYEASHLIEEQVISPTGALVRQVNYHYYPEESSIEEVTGAVVTKTKFNTLGQPIAIQVGDSFNTFGYDVCGNKITSTDGEGYCTKFAYDSHGRLIRKIMPDGSSFEYEYDAGSNVITFIMPSDMTWKASYDLIGRKCSEGLYAGGKATQTWSYVYFNGLLQEVRDPLERIHKYFYDSLGRLLSEKVGNQQRNYTYDGRGLLLSAEEIGQTRSLVNRSYDGCSRIISEEIYLESTLLQNTQQNWHPNGRTLVIGNHQRDFRYEDGEVKSVCADEVNIAYEYDLGGFLSNKKSPFGSVECEINPNGLLAKRSISVNGNNYLERLQWDRRGKAISFESHWPIPSTNRNFAYDSRGQVVKANDREYEYDFGKRGIGVRTGSAEHVIPANGLNPYSNPILEHIQQKKLQVQYDNLGQLISRKSPGFLWNTSLEQYKWDSWGQLIECTKDGCIFKAYYDALGRRLKTVQKSNGKTIETIAYFDPEEEFQEIGVKINKNVFWKLFGENTCEAIIDGDGNAIGLIHDALRNLVGVSSIDKVSWTYETPTAYGLCKERLSDEYDLVSFAQAHKWQSLRADATGLIWMGIRYYDPQIGNFLSADPISYPVNHNLHTYANGDPINNWDLDGRYSSAVYRHTSRAVIDSVSFVKEEFNEFSAGWEYGSTNTYNLDPSILNKSPTFEMGSALGGLLRRTDDVLDSVDNSAISPLLSVLPTTRLVSAVRNTWKTIQTYRSGKNFVGVLNKSRFRTNQDLSRSKDLTQLDKKIRKVSGTKINNYRKFILGNTRHNLSVRTGRWPDRSMEAHHVFSQKYRSDFARRGINIDDPKYLTWWEKGSHRSNAKEYNLIWRDFFEKNPNKDQILDKGRHIMLKYGLSADF